MYLLCSLKCQPVMKTILEHGAAGVTVDYASLFLRSAFIKINSMYSMINHFSPVEFDSKLLSRHHTQLSEINSSKSREDRNFACYCSLELCILWLTMPSFWRICTTQQEHVFVAQLVYMHHKLLFPSWPSHVTHKKLLIRSSAECKTHFVANFSLAKKTTCQLGFLNLTTIMSKAYFQTFLSQQLSILSQYASLEYPYLVKLQGLSFTHWGILGGDSGISCDFGNT